MKRIDVAFTAKSVQTAQIEGNIAVVIDVLRATSVICTALHQGAKSITPVETLEEAFALQQTGNILAGERKGFKPQGFLLGNSPLEYTPGIVKNKNIILTTTNGTRAIKNCTEARETIIASFLNIAAVCQYLQQQPRHVCIVCAGTENCFSLDDALCAGHIVSSMAAHTQHLQLTDSAFALKSIYQSHAANITQALAHGCTHYNYLKNNGFTTDVDYCLQKNIFQIVPKLIGNTIKI